MISTFTSCQSQTTALKIGDLFPTIEAQTLEDKKIIFPKDTEGKFTIIAAGFSQRAQQPINSWTDFVVSNYPNYNFYEVPIGNSNAAIYAESIDNAMKRGVPKELHSKTATYYGDLCENYMDLFGVTDKNNAYIFLLDKNGIILYKAVGFVNETIKTEFMKTIKNNN